MGRLLRGLLFVFAVIGLIVTSGCQPKPAGPGDRPPIIITDGSVRLRAVAHDRGNGTNKYRGKWFADGSNWYHDDSVNGGPKIMRVNVLYGASGTGSQAGQCTNDDFDFDYGEFWITYKKASDGTAATFRVFVQNIAGPPPSSRLTVEGPAAPDVLPFWLRVGEHDDELMSVRFPTTPNATECKLTPRVSEVHVYQKAQ